MGLTAQAIGVVKQKLSTVQAELDALKAQSASSASATQVYDVEDVAAIESVLGPGSTGVTADIGRAATATPQPIPNTPPIEGISPQKGVSDAGSIGSVGTPVT